MFEIVLIVIAAALGGAQDTESAAPAASPMAPQEAAVVPGLAAEPQVPSGRFTTAVEVRPILQATRANWVAVRDFNGQDLLYVTHLWSWRCGLAQIRIAVNDGPPEPWPLPDCHLDTNAPNAIRDGDGLPYRGFARGSVASVTVEITYDDLSVESARFDRAQILMP